MLTSDLLRAGENCWRVSRAARGGFYLSGRDYFLAFRRGVLAAERHVYVLAWDLSEKIETVRGGDCDDGYPSGLADFLFAALEAKPELRIHILLWDYSMVYVAEREWLPFTRWRREGHPRLHLALDDAIAGGASHHQKVVVVDDALAFCGGFDLSAWRWDTEEHRARDPRRVTPKGDPYRPYHELEVVVTGAAAKDFGDLCAMRWERATGEALPRIGRPPEPAPWPGGEAVSFEGEDLGIALTFSRHKGYAPSRQIERLHLDIIARAERHIYIENQYLSSHTLVEALAKRLGAPRGPEVVIVLTRDTGGWLEEGTMGVLRDRLLEILKEADAHGRFGVYYPHVADEAGHEEQVYVHAKLLIADDRLVEIGSANLSNRSMKVDSEADVVIAKDADTAYIAELLQRLLGIHFGLEPEAVARALADAGSLKACIESLRDGRRHRLEPMDVGCNNAIQRRLANTQLLDPDEPISPAYWVRELLRKGETAGQKRRRRWTTWAKVAAWLVIGAITAYALKEAWGSVIDKEAVMGHLESFRDSPMAAPILLAVFFLAGLSGLSINLLLVAATVALGPWLAFACGFTGSLASAAVAFGLGTRIGKPLLKKIANRRLETLSEVVGRRGPLSVALVRVVPIAPFPVINFVAGFSGLRFGTFIGGSVLGMAPGMVAVVLLTWRLRVAMAHPGWTTWFWVGAGVLSLGGAFAHLRKKYAHSRES